MLCPIHLLTANCGNFIAHFELERAWDSQFTDHVTSKTVSEDDAKYDDALDGKDKYLGFYYRVRALGDDDDMSDWSIPANVTAMPIIVGFYGADTPGQFPNDGNKVMDTIDQTIRGMGFQTRIFNSVWRKPVGNPQDEAAEWLLGELDLDGDGKYDPSNGDQARPVEIYGHSWGGTTAVKLAHQFTYSTKFLERDIAQVATIDPVTSFRLTPVHVDDNTAKFWNRYQTANRSVGFDIGPFIHVRPRGEWIPSASRDGGKKQKDLSLINGGMTRHYRPSGHSVPLTHFTIINEVKDELIDLLTNRAGA